MVDKSPRSIFRKFFAAEASSGIVILGCVILSLSIANSPMADAFRRLLDIPLGYRSEIVQLHFPIQTWINDGLMTVFFLLVGLEIKRELTNGELASPKKALLPILCATGGAITPALIYLLFNRGLDTQTGWGIPMATDIAFSLAVISMMSKSVPSSLKIFLTALAIADDLMAILVIAIFYSREIHINYLLYGGLIVLLLFILNRLKVNKPVFYLLPGLLLWYFIHHSGIHATIAGVLTAAFIPNKGVPGASPLQQLESSLTAPVNYIIVPLFALVNTNISFTSDMMQGLFAPLGMGIITGLVAGKPIGIFLAALLGIKTGICKMPQKAGWMDIIGIGLIAGIGFTMSIFISLLSFTDVNLISQAKFCILCASLIAACLGCLVLGRNARHRPGIS